MLFIWNKVLSSLYQSQLKAKKMNTPRIYAESVKSMVNSNYSEKSVDAMFQAESMLDDEMYTKQKYAGMDSSTKQDFMIYECDEISACNDVYDYYND